MDNMNVFTGKSGVLLIAEIGGNHEGDFEYAKELTRLACQSGADVVKFQVYSGESLVSQVEDPSRVKHFNKFALTKGQYLELARLCVEYGARFNASVWDVSSIDYLDEFLDFYKVGSGDLTAFPVLEKVAKIGKPIILSTGLSTLDDVVEAVAFIQDINEIYKDPDMLAVLQCTSMYPIPDEEANVAVMHKLKKEFGCTVGYSDHTVGSMALEVAVAAGAKVLEFHFTDTREGKEFRDHKVSLTAEEVKILSAKIEKTLTILGGGIKKPTPSEISNDHVRTFRRSVYLNKDLKEGDLISEADIVTLRPNNGVDARLYKDVIGKKLKRDILATEAFKISDLS